MLAPFTRWFARQEPGPPVEGPPPVPASPRQATGHVFISYAATDRDAARVVGEYLESRGWTVWWDRQIPAGRAYDQVIEEALAAAAGVLVLWSKAAVASRWVRSEASEAARREIAVPVLLEDVVVPLEFRLVQAVDLRAWDRTPAAPALDALDRAIARIVNAAPDAADSGRLKPEATDSSRLKTAANSHVSRSVPRSIVWLAVLLSITIAASWYWDAFYREHTDYYANVTRRWGLPEGIGPLTAAQVAQRNASIALVRHGRRNPAAEVRIVNPEGSTPPQGKFFPSASMADLNPLQSFDIGDPQSAEMLQVVRVGFSRDADGRVLEQTGFARSGRRVYTIHFPAPGLGEYKRQGFGAAVRDSGIAYVRISQVAGGAHAGLDERVRYFDDRQQPQPDEHSVYGVRFVFDDSGLTHEWINLDANGRDKANGVGVLAELREHDALGNVTEATSVDERRQIHNGSLGVAVTRLQHDRAGNLTRVSLYDAQRQPVALPSLGAAGYALTYDGHGNLTSQTFFGPDQKPVIAAPGFARLAVEWSGARRSLERFFGVAGQPIPALGGVFQALETWDERGYAIETIFQDDRGEPTRTGDGCAIMRLQYDDDGNVRQFKCLNEQGAPTTSVDGASTGETSYDAAGHPLTTTFFDQQGQPGVVGDSYASVRRSYNTFGRLEKESFLDARGEPVIRRDGYSSASYEYDRSGNQVATVLWDARGTRTVGSAGYSAIRRTFDERRLEIESVYLDARDQPVVNRDGFATIRYRYDQRGFITRFARFCKDGRPCRGTDGIASGNIRYNEAGQRLEVSYFDEADRPTQATRTGSAKRRWKYDDGGRVAERSDHDADGRAIINAFGYATVRYDYDPHGRETGRSLFDDKGRPLRFHVSVDRVAPRSAAADSGLQPGDVILTYDGQAVATSDQFTTRLEVFRGDRRRELGIARGDRQLSLAVSPGRLHGLELVERAVTDGAAR